MLTQRYIGRTLSAMFILIFLGGIFSQSLHSQNLRAHYPMHGNANDASGNGNHGTPKGTNISLTSDHNGIANQAYLLNAYGEYIEYTGNSTFRPVLPVTITGWVRNDATGSNKSFMVFTNSYRDNKYDGIWLSITGDNHISAAYAKETLLGVVPEDPKRGPLCYNLDNGIMLLLSSNRTQILMYM